MLAQPNSDRGPGALLEALQGPRSQPRLPVPRPGPGGFLVPPLPGKPAISTQTPAGAGYGEQGSRSPLHELLRDLK